MISPVAKWMLFVLFCLTVLSPDPFQACNYPCLKTIKFFTLFHSEVPCAGVTGECANRNVVPDCNVCSFSYMTLDWFWFITIVSLTCVVTDDWANREVKALLFSLGEIITKLPPALHLLCWLKHWFNIMWLMNSLLHHLWMICKIFLCASIYTCTCNWWSFVCLSRSALKMKNTGSILFTPVHKIFPRHKKHEFCVCGLWSKKDSFLQRNHFFFTFINNST